MSAWEDFQSGRFDAAQRTLRQVLQKAPGEPNANKLMALLHGAKHEDERALFYITRAAEASPGDAEVHFIRGNVLFLMRRFDEAIAPLTQSLAIDPSYAPAVDVLAKCLLTLGRGNDAAGVYERALGANPRHVRLYAELASTYCEIGRAEDAAAALTRGLASCPNERDMLMAAACYQNFVDTDPNVHRELHRRLAGGTLVQPARLARLGNRPPRVALLSSDFRDHACGTFLRPLVEYWGETPVYLYSAVTRPDAWTAWFAARGEWREVGELDSAGLRRRCLDDGIDVLIECNGWTEGTRLALMRERVAPVQGTFLGYPNTTGSPGIDFRLVDEVTDPPGSEWHGTERLARIAGCFLCYAPGKDDPEPEETAALREGGGDVPVTFGCFNRLAKVSGRTVRVWAEILKRTPSSRLLLKSRVQSEALNREFAGRFGVLGVDPARIEFSPYAPGHREHLELYRAMDVALDCFPYNGTTTTCEALSMGVPVLTLEGGVHRARVGASLLRAAGMPEWVTANEHAYVQKAVELVTDRGALRRARAGLRERFAASVLCDSAGYAARVRAAIDQVLGGA